MKRQTKTQVKKEIRDNGQWMGWIVPCNVSTFHIRGGWALGYHTTFTSLNDMESQVNDFTHYNCNSELGYYVAFYKE